MRDATRKLNVALGRHVPPLRIFVKSDGGTRYFELSPLKQILGGSIAAAAAGWMLVASAALVVNSLSADSAVNQTQVLRDAYEARIAALTAERDTGLAEAAEARTRFQTALAEVSSQQQSLLTALGEQASLKAELSVMQAKFAVASLQADEAEAQNQRLQLASTAPLPATGATGSAELADTLTTVSLALSETLEERNEAEANGAALQAQISGLELKMKVNTQKQERLMTRLEEAVTTSYAPLADMFEAAGLDVGHIVGDVQAENSGAGGPLVPFVSTKGTDAPAVMEMASLTPDDRFQTLLGRIDAVNSLQIAAAGLPFGNPVDGPYRFTSGFGGRHDPKNGSWRQHNGLDFAGAKGTDIVATGDGVVVFAGQEHGFGNLIKIRHTNGYESVYGHLSAIDVKVGDHVSRGDHIGDMGNTGRSTGTHLHYEIRLSGDPLNPMTFLEAARNVF